LHTNQFTGRSKERYYISTLPRPQRYNLNVMEKFSNSVRNTLHLICST